MFPAIRQPAPSPSPGVSIFFPLSICLLSDIGYFPPIPPHLNAPLFPAGSLAAAVAASNRWWRHRYAVSTTARRPQQRWWLQIARGELYLWRGISYGWRRRHGTRTRSSSKIWQCRTITLWISVDQHDEKDSNQVGFRFLFIWVLTWLFNQNSK